MCLGGIGFHPLKSELCVYINEDIVGFVLLTLFVDDLFLLVTKNLLLNNLEKQLIYRVKMTETGEVTIGLGMNVTRDRDKGTIVNCQRDYREDVIERLV